MGKYTTKTYKGHRVDPETGEVLEYSECIEVIKEETEPFFPNIQQANIGSIW